jgi:hypothetical protein
VDWEKVGSSHARPLSEMGEFFHRAKKYAPKIVSLISLSASSSTSAPRSSTTPFSAPDDSAPSTTDDPQVYGVHRSTFDK